jgi:uncharacterized DUF497 family protein
MKAEQELEKDALAIEEAPTVYTDLSAVVIEAEKPCRTQSQLPFLGANGVFTGVEKSSISVIVRGIRIEVIRFNLTVNTALVKFRPSKPTPNCNNEGVTFLPAQSVNVAAVAEPQYILRNQIVTNVILFFTRVNKAKPATLGIRAKFEENGMPKRKAGQISFP